MGRGCIASIKSGGETAKSWTFLKEGSNNIQRPIINSSAAWGNEKHTGRNERQDGPRESSQVAQVERPRKRKGTLAQQQPTGKQPDGLEGSANMTPKAPRYKVPGNPMGIGMRHLVRTEQKNGAEASTTGIQKGTLAQPIEELQPKKPKLSIYPQKSVEISDSSKDAEVMELTPTSRTAAISLKSPAQRRQDEKLGYPHLSTAQNSPVR